MVGHEQDGGAQQDAFGGGGDEAQALERVGDRQDAGIVTGPTVAPGYSAMCSVR